MIRLRGAPHHREAMDGLRNTIGYVISVAVYGVKLAEDSVLATATAGIWADAYGVTVETFTILASRAVSPKNSYQAQPEPPPQPHRLSLATALENATRAGLN